jgi:ribosomal protein S18 acetylase RimI-like enzyme
METRGDDTRRPPESVIIQKARPEDREAVLEVMRPWNMHHVPSPEMESIDLSCFFVVRLDGRIVGAAGYKILPGGQGKTTLLGVLPDYAGRGIGSALQDARLRAMARFGVEVVTTNADRPATIRWYKRRFGYREVGRLEKLHSFGDPNLSHWTTLQLDLLEYIGGPKENDGGPSGRRQP